MHVSGTRTFLFTDIEGSTRLWEAFRDSMSLALASHDRILRDAIEAREGVVFKTVGDAFCAVFASVSAAADAAIIAQRRLAAENWGAFGDDFDALSVRMAIHAGEAEERDGDYFGPPLNRVARLLAAGHGGQVLISLSAHSLLMDRLPEGVELADLGTYRLKDLSRPERVFQLLAEGLPSQFPPLRADGKRPGNLPPRSSSFVGRHEELTRLQKMLEAQRLITLTGIGGIGKTRLALEAATSIAEHFPDGVWLVDLAAISEPEMVLPALANVLGLREVPGQPLARIVEDALRPRRSLFVLDNCEHLLDAAANLAEMVLAAGAGLSIIATSRERLGIAAEACLPLSPLSASGPSQDNSPEALAQIDAVRLFVDRAASVVPDFSLDALSAPSVASLCARLDGLPLAIELAAARVRLMSPAEILKRLDHRFRLLSGNPRNLQPRQQTLSAMIDWSHNLLTADEKALFRRLAVFRGSWSLEAAEAVCSDERVPDWEVLALLAQLVEKSLVLAESSGAETRYRYLETLRHYAQERLEASGEREALQDRLLGWCTRLAESAAQELEGPRQPEWLDRISDELDNLRAVLDRSAAGRNPAAGLHLAASLGHWWYQRGRPAEARSRLEALLEAAGTAATAPVRARAWRILGAVTMYQGEPEAAGRAFEAAADAIGDADADELARIRVQHAWQAWVAGEPERMTEQWRAATEHFGADARPWDRGLVAMIGCIVADHEGELALAIERSRASLANFERSGDPFYTAIAINNLGWGLVLLERSNEAVVVLERGRALCEAQGYDIALSHNVESLARAAQEAGRPRLARDCILDVLKLNRRQGILWNVAISLQHLAALEIEEDRAEEAAGLLGAGEAVMNALGQAAAQSTPELRAKLIGSTQDMLGREAAAAAFAAGRALDIDQAIELGIRRAELVGGTERALSDG